MGRQGNTDKTELATTNGGLPSAEIIERVVMDGDLSKLTPEQRLTYYKSVCDTLKLNPLTKPFDYIVLDKKLVLYARKDCTEQLRKRYKISLSITARERQDSVYVVVAQATLPNGRFDEAMGAVSIMGKSDNGTFFELKGNALANAVMKAETKAKRRVTLSICGLGIMDESELETTDFDQRPQAEIMERNVREATANATEVSPVSEAKPIPGDVVHTNTNEYGPLNITEDNYKDLKVHIGKAQGTMLGRKVGEVHPNIIEWLHNKWIPGLNPSASDQDMRLKKAIEFATKALAGTVMDRDATIKALRERCEDLCMTEEQVCGYLRKHKVATEQNFSEMPDSQLSYLLQNWETAKGLIELEVKPQPATEQKGKHGKKRK